MNPGGMVSLLYDGQLMVKKTAGYMRLPKNYNFFLFLSTVYNYVNKFCSFSDSFNDWFYSFHCYPSFLNSLLFCFLTVISIVFNLLIVKQKHVLVCCIIRKWAAKDGSYILNCLKTSDTCSLVKALQTPMYQGLWRLWASEAIIVRAYTNLLQNKPPSVGITVI